MWKKEILKRSTQNKTHATSQVIKINTKGKADWIHKLSRGKKIWRCWVICCADMKKTSSEKKSGLSKCAFKQWLCRIRTGGVGRQARRIASELLLPLLLMMLLLCREDEQEDEGALEVRVEDEEECSEEYLGSGKLVWAMAKGCLLFRDIIIIFAGAKASASSF